MFARSSLLALLLASTATVVACQAPVEEAGESGDAVMGVGDRKVLSEDANRLLDIPSYFGVTKLAANGVDVGDTGFPTLWNPSKDSAAAGLRIIAIKQDVVKGQWLPDEPDEDATAAEKAAYKAKKKEITLANIPAKKKARQSMSEKLAAAGVIQDGDIVLTFRPEYQGTIPYIHVQMGTTHASVAYLKESGGTKTAWNVDSPMKGDDYVGQFNAAHFVGGLDATSGDADLGTDALHIIRPRVMKDANRRAQHRFWASKIAQNRAGNHISFNSDYNAPSSPSKELAKKNITNIGKLALGLSAADMSIYCSEFAWHILALSNCSEQEIRSAGPDGAQCAESGIVFDQMKLAEIDGGENIGLTEGPLNAILAAPGAERAAMIGGIFKAGGGAKLSAGHRKMAADTASLMGPLNYYYGVRANGSQLDAEKHAMAAQVIASKPLNYSPTAFIAQASRTDAARPMDYVGTVVFVDTDADLAKAERLAGH